MTLDCVHTLAALHFASMLECPRRVFAWLNDLDLVGNMCACACACVCVRVLVYVSVQPTFRLNVDASFRLLILLAGADCKDSNSGAPRF